MVASAYRPAITPTLMLCLGDFGDQVAQALIPEMEAAGPAVQAAVRWLRVTWPEAGGIRVLDGANRVLLEADRGAEGLLAGIRDQVEAALRDIGLHAVREELLRAGYGLPGDRPDGRRARCYMVAALREAQVTATLKPLLTHVYALLTPRHGPRSVAAFLNIATHRLVPDAPQRATVAATLRSLADWAVGQPSSRVRPWVLLNWIKAGGVYAEGDRELCAALIALLRVLLLADEPAALLEEALPKTFPDSGDPSVFCSVGIAVVQSPPRQAVLDWLASRWMAEFLSRRCLDPLEGPPEITVGNGRQAADCLGLQVLLEALAEGLEVKLTAEPGLIVSAFGERFDRPSDTIETAMARVGRSLTGQVHRNQSKLYARLLSEADPIGQLPYALAQEIDRGPHSLRAAEALLEAVAEQIQVGQTVLAQKRTRWPLRHDRLARRVHQAQAARHKAEQTLPSPKALLIKLGVTASFWGGLFGMWAGRVCGAGGIAGAVLTATLLAIAVIVWRFVFKRRQVRHAQRAYATAVAALQSAQVENAWLGAAQFILAEAEGWHERQIRRLRTIRKRLANVQALLAAHEPQLPSNPIVIETLPYLGGYAKWLQTALQDDPLMSETQSVLEQRLEHWSDLKEKALYRDLVKAGLDALPDVPELSVEDVLISQGEEAATFHLQRLHHLATPFVDLERPAIPSSSGEPSTLNIACWEHCALAQLHGWLEHDGARPASVARTGDPQRVTYIRLIPGFALADLGSSYGNRSSPYDAQD